MKGHSKGETEIATLQLKVVVDDGWLFLSSMLFSSDFNTVKFDVSTTFNWLNLCDLYCLMLDLFLLITLKNFIINEVDFDTFIKIS